MRRLDPARVPRSARWSRWRVGLAAAASVLLLALVGTWLLADGPAGVDDYLVPYETTFAVRGDDTNAASPWAYYDAGDYDAAAAAFAELDASDASVAFYRGVSLLLSGDAAGAVPILRELVARDDHLYVEQARWYLGLALLRDSEEFAKTGRDAEARATLSEIEADAYRFAEAQELLGTLSGE